MEQNYGIYMIGAILLTWTIGVVCIILDFFVKPKTIYVKTHQRPSYSNKYNTEESYIILDNETNNPKNIHGSLSYIFESMDDSLT